MIKSQSIDIDIDCEVVFRVEMGCYWWNHFLNFLMMHDSLGKGGRGLVDLELGFSLCSVWG